MQIHVIQRGQTLWSLGQLYRVSAQAIANVNGIEDPTNLVVGQSIVIPTPSGTYVVQPGDSLYEIAARFGTSVSTLASQNQIQNPNVLSVGQVLRVPSTVRGTIEVNAYLTDFGSSGQQAVQTLGSVLTYLSPFSYHVQSDGSIVSISDTTVLSTAKSQGVAPLMVITNWQGSMFSSDLAHTVLNSESIQQTLINNVLSTMASKGHRGLNIDFEYVYPQDRDGYNAFLQRVVTALHAEGYLVSTALAPKVSASQTGLLYEAHDYPVHGSLCDFVVLMTYEWGYMGGPPMAVSPLNQMQNVMNYAVTAIPRSKILTGVSVYGYDWKLPWVSGTLAQTLSPLGAVQRAAQYGAEIQYDTTSEAPYYNYVDASGTTHVVWFEDPRSFQAKLDFVRSYGLRGISFWSYPTEFPQVPTILASNYGSVKLSGASAS